MMENSMSRKNKAQCQLDHFRRRMRERFGLHLNEGDIRNIVHQIQTGQSEMIDRQSNRVSVHRLTYKGEQINVAYDGQRGTLVTALMPEWEPQTCGRLL